MLCYRTVASWPTSRPTHLMWPHHPFVVTLMIIVLLSIPLARPDKLHEAISLTELPALDPLSTRCTVPHLSCLCARPPPDIGFMHCGSHLRLARLTGKFFRFTAHALIRLHVLQLSHTGLRSLANSSFVGTGLQVLLLTHNHLTHVPSDCFDGLQRSLRVLSLKHNLLTELPVTSLQSLRRLNSLDLSHNQIGTLKSWPDSIGQSLHTLNLADNDLSFVDAYVFASLTSLRSLDLSHNRLVHVHEHAFVRPSTSSQSQLDRLYLDHNRLAQFPCRLLARLKSLQNFRLKANRLTQLPERTCGRERFRLQSLDLSSNRIGSLTNLSFAAFASIYQLTLNHNRLIELPSKLFDTTSIVWLQLQNAHIRHISPDCFVGIHRQLRRLDLSSNPLRLPSTSAMHTSALSSKLDAQSIVAQHSAMISSSSSSASHSDPLAVLEQLTHFRLQSPLDSFIPSPLSFAQSSFSLETLEIDATNQAQEMKANNPTDLQLPVELEFSALRSLRLPLNDDEAARGWPQLRTMGAGGQLFELDLSQQSLQSLSNPHLFQPLRSLSRLDLSDNALQSIHSAVFRPLANTLHSLYLHQSLHSSVAVFDCALIAMLQRLQVLTLAGNQLERLSSPGTCFTHLQQLRMLDLQANHLDHVCFASFTAMHALQHFQAAHNRATRVRSHCFSQLPSLQFIDLSFNQIKKIEPNAFHELPSLRLLDLSYNRIQIVADAAFTLLSNLQELRLQHNHLAQIHLSCLDLVGGIGAQLKLDLQFNHIAIVSSNSQAQASAASFKAPSKPTMDEFSSSSESTDQLSPTTLTRLQLSANQLTILPNHIIHELSPYLQQLDLSRNQLSAIVAGSFSNCPELQDVQLWGNHLTQLPAFLFNGTSKLRTLNLSQNALDELPHVLFDRRCHLLSLDLSSNRLRRLPNKLLTNCDRLQFLRLSHNQLTEFPSNMLQQLSSYNHFQLAELALSHNQINQLPLWPPESVQLHHFAHSLLLLDLSFNRLSYIPIEFSARLKSLQYLDLSYNPLRTLSPESLRSIPHLQHLLVSHCSLNTLTPLPLKELRHLDLSHNQLSSLHGGAFVHTPELRHLDCSHNRLTHVPSALLTLSASLRSLRLSANPLQALFNDSFVGLSLLTSLDLQPLPSLSKIDLGALRPLQSLRELYIAARLPRPICDILPPLDHLHRLHLRFELNSYSKNAFSSDSSSSWSDTNDVEADEELFLCPHRSPFTQSSVNWQWPSHLQELWLSGNGLERLQWSRLPSFNSSTNLLLRVHSTVQMPLDDQLLTNLLPVSHLDLQLQNCRLQLHQPHSVTLRRRLTEVSFSLLFFLSACKYTLSSALCMCTFFSLPTLHWRKDTSD